MSKDNEDREKSREDEVINFARKTRLGEKEQFQFVNDNPEEQPLIPFPDGWYASS